MTSSFLKPLLARPELKRRVWSLSCLKEKNLPEGASICERQNVVLISSVQQTAGIKDILLTVAGVPRLILVGKISYTCQFKNKLFIKLNMQLQHMFFFQNQPLAPPVMVRNLGVVLI